jgi:hypothetical protein
MPYGEVYLAGGEGLEMSGAWEWGSWFIVGRYFISIFVQHCLLIRYSSDVIGPFHPPQA